MKWLPILAVAVCLFPTLADADCEAAESAQVVLVLRQGIELNERFRRAVDAGDKSAYSELRQQNEQYNEDMALPCVVRAAALLDRQRDDTLLRQLLAYAVSRQNSADETIPEALASVFAKYPEAVTSNLALLSPGAAMVVLRRIEAGWPGVRGALEPAVRRDRDRRLKSLRAEQLKRAEATAR